MKGFKIVLEWVVDRLMALKKNSLVVVEIRDKSKAYIPRQL